MFYYITTFSSTSSTTLYQIVMPENSTLIKSQKNLYYTFFMYLCIVTFSLRPYDETKEN